MPNPILFFQPLEKFLSDSNIQNLEMEFESQFYDEYGNFSGRAIIAGKEIEDISGIHKLEDFVFERFKPVLESVKSEIDYFIGFGTVDRYKLENYIIKSYNNLLSEAYSKYKGFSIVKSSLSIDLKQYLFSKYAIQILKPNRFAPTSAFHYIGSKPQLRKIYNECVNHNLIFDVNKVPYEMFEEVFTLKNTDSVLQFACTTPLAVGFMDILKPLFKNLNEKTVGGSKRFMTRSNHILTYGNYQTARNALKKSNEKNNQLLTLKSIVSQAISTK